MKGLLFPRHCPVPTDSLAGGTWRRCISVALCDAQEGTTQTATTRRQATSLLRLMMRLVLVATLGAAATGCGPELTVSYEEVLAQHSRHLPGLDEEVVFVLAKVDGSGSYKYVLREDGRQQAPGMVRREEAEMYRERFGAMTPDLYVRTLEAVPEERIRVAVPPPAASAREPRASPSRSAWAGTPAGARAARGGDGRMDGTDGRGATGNEGRAGSRGAVDACGVR